MAKRLRSEEEERESSWITAKRQMCDDGGCGDQNDVVGDDFLALLLLDAPAEDDDIGAALLSSGSDSPSFFDAYGYMYDEVSEAKADAAAKVRFAKDLYGSSPAGVFQTTASSYVTINGNDETCGSSFSDCDSSVMASVDVGGIGLGFLADRRGACLSRAGECGGGEWDGDDASLARFLDEVLSSEHLQLWMDWL